MAKLTKEELLKKVDDSSMSDDEKISFMEDISDSFDNVDTTELENAKNDLESVKTELELLKSKYKERFLSGEEIAKVEEKVEDAIDEIDPEMKEEEVIDVKDIYIDEESEVKEDGEE